MTPYSALREGIRRVGRAPALLVGVWLATVIVSLPLTIALGRSIGRQLDASLEADTAAASVNYDWMEEYGAQATGVGVTFRPTIVGFGAVLDNLSGFIDNVHRPATIVSAAAAYLALWVFVAGGIINRYARDRRTRASGFLAASRVFFFRFLRLGVLMAAAYGVLFGWLHPWMFDRLYPRLVADVTVERTAFFTRAALYAVFALVLASFNLLFDYAKVRAVVEDRRSMMGALIAAWRFIRRNTAAAATLYVADVVLFLFVISVYAVMAPNAGGTGWLIWVGLAIGQCYIFARLWVKLVFWASETVMFQNGSGL